MMRQNRRTVFVMALGVWVAGCDERGDHRLPRPADAPASPVEAGEMTSDSAASVPNRTAVPAGSEDVAAATASTVGILTDAALAELSIGLDVPVSGVERSQLRDTYTEARGDRAHEALDIHAPRGTPVLSAADGRLLKIFNSEPGGLMVYATDATERFILLYGHMDGYAEGLAEGMPLARGQVIGYVGTTGNAAPDAPHLHFGILRGDPSVSWWEGAPINPYPLLTGGR